MISPQDLVDASSPAVSLIGRQAGSIQPTGRGTSVSASGRRDDILSLAASAGLFAEASPSGIRPLSYGTRNPKVEGEFARSINNVRPSVADVPALIEGALSGVRAWSPPV